MATLQTPTISGDSREAVLCSIVAGLAFAEGLSNIGEPPFTKRMDRAWIREAFAFARECLDGRSAEDFLDAISDEES